MKDKVKKHMEAIRERSGNVTIDCKLASFLYTLMRDYVQPGIVEKIMLDHISDETVEYSNGWLAMYANDIANRLKSKPIVKNTKRNRFAETDKYIQYVKQMLSGVSDKDTSVELHNILFKALTHCLVFNLDGARVLYEVSLMPIVSGKDNLLKSLEKEFPEFAIVNF